MREKLEGHRRAIALLILFSMLFTGLFRPENVLPVKAEGTGEGGTQGSTEITELSIGIPALNASESFPVKERIAIDDNYRVTDLTWKNGDELLTEEASVEYYTAYTACVTLKPIPGYTFADVPQAKVNNSTVESRSVSHKPDGSITITYTFPKILMPTYGPFYTGLPNGMSLDELRETLGSTISIDTDGNSNNRDCQITWDLENFAEGTYDPNSLEEQRFWVNGTIRLPDGGIQITKFYVQTNAAGYVSDPVANLEEGSYTENKSVALTSETVDAEIYYTTDGTDPDPSKNNGTKYTGPISVTGEEGKTVTTRIKAIAVKNHMHDSEIQEFTYKITLPDTTAPTAEIKIGDTVLNGSSSDIAYEYFYKTKKTVTITATDNVTETPTIEYCVSERELSSDDLTGSGIAWTTYTAPFALDAKSKKIVYAKVTDTVGNKTIVNSAGIVVYQDSLAVTQEITFVKGVTEEDLDADVSLNGNTIDSVKNGDTTLVKGTDYSISDGVITFKKAYLETLSVADTPYTLTVSYHPLGEIYQEKTGNDAPATTQIRLTVRNPKLTGVEGGTLPCPTGLPNGTAKTVDALRLSKTVTIHTEAGDKTANITWDLVNLADGTTYDPSKLEEQTFYVNGTVTLPEGIINPDAISLAVQVSVSVNEADHVSDPAAGLTEGTYTENKSLVLTSATEGAEIYYTMDGSEPSKENGRKYTDKITVAGTEGQSVTTRIKAIAYKDGMYPSGVQTFTYTIELPDTTAPTAEIKIGENNWNNLWNNVPFESFFKNKKTVTISAQDNVTQSPTIAYYLSERELSESEVKGSGILWTPYTAPFALDARSKKIVYAKVTDTVGNKTIVNSAGIIVYQDSLAVTEEIIFVKGVTGDLDATVSLNGNTIDSVKKGDTTLVKGTDYSISDGVITFKKAYLERLTVADTPYTLTVSYHPMGETYQEKTGNEAPATTQIRLTVRKPKLTGVEGGTLPCPTGLPNGTAKKVDALRLSKTVTIHTEAGDKTANITWDLVNLADGTTYDPSKLEEQTFYVNGTVTLPEGIINPDAISLAVKVFVSVNEAGTVHVPAPAPSPGTYEANQSVTLYSDTEGAEIYYTTDGSEPSKENGRKYTDKITVAGTEGQSVTTRIKAIAYKDGMYPSEVQTFTYTIELPDITAPTAEIKIGENNWNNLWNNVPFEYFFKNTKTVTISAQDNVTENPTITYYLSERELSEDDLAGSGIRWTTYTAPFALNANSKKIVYAKVTDGAGNKTIINSAGIVVYQDSLAVTEEIIFVKGVTGDLDATVSLNGNTIDSVKKGDTTLVKGTDYSISDGVITFKKAYLERLTVADTPYTLTVSYHPMGETYQEKTGNEAPATTQIRLTVRKPKLTGVEGGTLPCPTGLPNGTAKTVDALRLSKTVTIHTEAGDKTANITWDLVNLADGTTYDPSKLEEQTFKINGRVELPEGIINPDNKSLLVTVSVSVNEADHVSDPAAGLTEGTYTENKSLVLTSATEDADIYYTMDGSEPSKENGRKYTDKITVAGTEGQSVTTRIKAIAYKAGMLPSEVKTFTYTIELPDITPPEVEIKIGDQVLGESATDILYDSFYKKPLTVTLTATDNVSVAPKIEYYISEQGEMTETTIPWKPYTEPFELKENAKQIVYVKATDSAGKETIVRSGIVIYQDSVAVTKEITFIKNVTNELTAEVTWNGNTIASIKNGSDILVKDRDYSVKDGKIIFSNDYLKSLELKDTPYILTISFCPLGEIYQEKTGNEPPAEEQIQLIIRNKHLKGVGAIPSQEPLPNGTEKTVSALGLVEKVMIQTEAGNETADITWALNKADYNPNKLEEQTFEVEGTVVLPKEIENPDNISLSVKAFVRVREADHVSAPKASLAAGTYQEAKTVSLSCATEGAELYYTTDGTKPSKENGTKYTSEISVTGTEGQSVVTTIKAIAYKEGMCASDVSVYSYTIEIPDTTAPTAMITIGDHSWNQWWDTVTFDSFYKNKKSVTITASDNVSSGLTIAYYVSDREVTKAELADTGITWTPYTGSFDINANVKKIIYAKVTDAAGNVTIVNSQGIVIYTESSAVNRELTYIKNVTKELTAEVNLNGNTIDSVKQGENVLVKDTDYSIEEGKIAFARSYLDTLAVASTPYILTVSYLPMGERYQEKTGNELPADINIQLTVRNPKLTAIDRSSLPLETSLPNGTLKTTEAFGLVEKVSIQTEVGTETADITWNLDQVAYDPEKREEQTFDVIGKVILPEGIGNPDDISLSVKVSVTIEAAEPVITPTATPEVTPTATPELTPTATPELTPTATPELTPTATPELTPTATPELTPTATPVVTPTPTPVVTPTPTPVVTPTLTPVVTPTATPEIKTSAPMAKKKKTTLKTMVGAYAGWKNNKFTFAWKKEKDAQGYDIFAAECGKKIGKKSLVKTISGDKTSTQLAKISGKELSDKKAYKVFVKAFKKVNGKKVYIAKSMLCHVAGQKNATFTNVKKVKISQDSFVLKEKKTKAIRAKLVKQSKKKKLLEKWHGLALRYFSTNKAVATVDKKGKISAKKKGTCDIYVIALNGISTKVKVTVN